MVYQGTSKTETIWVCPANDFEDMHCIELIRSDDEDVFYVTVCCNEDWLWAFYMDGASNYEMVKHAIMNAVCDCCSMGCLLNALDEIFMENFEDIMVEDENECNECCCENCDHRDCLN